MARTEFSGFAMELKKFLVDNNDERQHDVEFINGRSDAAAAAFEDARHQGPFLRAHMFLRPDGAVLLCFMLHDPLRFLALYHICTPPAIDSHLSNAADRYMINNGKIL